MFEEITIFYIEQSRKNLLAPTPSVLKNKITKIKAVVTEDAKTKIVETGSTKRKNNCKNLLRYKRPNNCISVDMKNTIGFKNKNRSTKNANVTSIC